MNYEPVKINLNLEKLRALNATLEVLGHEPVEDRTQRVFRSILKEIGIKLVKKQLDVFPGTKDFAYRLKFYQADVLEQWILFYLQGSEKNYQNHLLKVVADDINQKLA